MLDTRTKIVTSDKAPRGRRVVASYFDPMLPDHLALLRALAGEGTLLVVLATPPDAYLEAGARAELAASLSVVESVVIAGDDVEATIAELDPLERLDVEQQELALRTEFLGYVRERAKHERAKQR